MLVKSRREEDHFKDLEEIFSTFRSYNMKLNLSKCIRSNSGKIVRLYGVSKRH